MFHIQPSPLEGKTAKKGIKLIRTRFLQPPKFAVQSSAGDYSRLADGERKGVGEKMGVYSAELNGARAAAVSVSPPGSGHSAVALETAQAPQNGESQSPDAADASGDQRQREAAGADLHCDQLVMCELCWHKQAQELFRLSYKQQHEFSV